jgi:drug/metabolite transporter (DMT)-like permease
MYAVPHSKIHFKTLFFICLSILLGPLGNVMLGKGMKGLGETHISNLATLAETAQHAFLTPALWLGIACLLGFFLVHMLLLTWADYSYVQPSTALAYASVALLSYLLLGEKVSPLRWAGITTICLGVIIVGRTAPNTTLDARGST